MTWCSPQKMGSMSGATILWMILRFHPFSFTLPAGANVRRNSGSVANSKFCIFDQGANNPHASDARVTLWCSLAALVWPLFRSVLSGFRGGLGVVRCGVILYSNLLKGVSVHPSNYCSVCGASIDECRSAPLLVKTSSFVFLDHRRRGSTWLYPLYRCIQNVYESKLWSNPAESTKRPLAFWRDVLVDFMWSMLHFEFVDYLDTFAKAERSKCIPIYPKVLYSKKWNHRRQELVAATIFHPVRAAVLMFACTVLLWCKMLWLETWNEQNRSTRL